MTDRVPPGGRGSAPARVPQGTASDVRGASPDPITDPGVAAFFALHHGLPRQGPGSDATTRRLLAMAGPLPPRPRVLDIGCGPGRASLLLAQEVAAEVTAVDVHRPFLDELTRAAAARGVGHAIRTVEASMADLPFPDGSFDLIWAEGSVYNIGFDTALHSWRRLLAPGGTLVVTECEWTADSPSVEAQVFWERHYRLRTQARNAAAARDAGYDVVASYPLPDSDWFGEYYTPLSERAGAADLTVPGMREAVAATLQEIILRREHGADYQYTGYVLRPQASTETDLSTPMTTSWITRPETAADLAQIREVNLAAFPTSHEADLVEALRADSQAWIPGLSWVTEAPDGSIAGFALFTRCHVDGSAALTLGPCAVRPEYQRSGAGSAAIRAGLQAAREQGENLVLVLGHAEYYPRFGFTPASGYAIRPPFEVEDKYMMALVFDPNVSVPTGTIRYPAAFGV
ncbi:putative N-acetyltransferase YhbS/trans-aconitate methyltransferase [Nonomuraea muscovyensis]|uniref:Putative N-acetyltransferase YhbS/trans-aconitate methyltransferase n=2 Tax=Nonomuraea muscovyensis TaxID=1124761 RepID=A0A7X0C5J5_9ACTN|nr:putative N-acetyltransferase YhbS/trans-aconitate methyltransferase [Nonomuraea muscovyensis]